MAAEECVYYSIASDVVAQVEMKEVKIKKALRDNNSREEEKLNMRKRSVTNYIRHHIIILAPMTALFLVNFALISFLFITVSDQVKTGTFQNSTDTREPLMRNLSSEIETLQQKEGYLTDKVTVSHMCVNVRPSFLEITEFVF